MSYLTWLAILGLVLLVLGAILTLPFTCCSLNPSLEEWRDVGTSSWDFIVMMLLGMISMMIGSLLALIGGLTARPHFMGISLFVIGFICLICSSGGYIDEVKSPVEDKVGLGYILLFWLPGIICLIEGITLAVMTGKTAVANKTNTPESSPGPH